MTSAFLLLLLGGSAAATRPPDAAEWEYRIGNKSIQVYRREGNRNYLTEALEHLNSAVTSRGGATPPAWRLTQARLLVETSDLTQAASVAEAAVAEAAKEKDWVTLAELHFEAGDFPEAWNAAEKAVGARQSACEMRAIEMLCNRHRNPDAEESPGYGYAKEECLGEGDQPYRDLLSGFYIMETAQPHHQAATYNEGVDLLDRLLRSRQLIGRLRRDVLDELERNYIYSMPDASGHIRPRP